MIRTIILLYREDKLSDRYLKANPFGYVLSNNAAQLDYSMIYNPTYEPNRFLSKVLSWRLRALLIRIDTSVFYEDNDAKTRGSIYNVQELNSFHYNSNH